MIEFGILNCGKGGTFQDMKRVWLEVERLGFDYAWGFDNVVGPLTGGRRSYDVTARSAPHGEIDRAEAAEAIDFWSVAGALAEATKRIRIGPLATPSGRRHPALFAKMTSMLDVISGGRLEVAMGPGDHEWQFLPWGMSYPPKPSERIEILREEIDVLKRMWTQERAWYQGKHYKLEGAYNNPKPVQKPHPPLWIGINQDGKKLMPRLAAEHADGVNINTVRDDDEVKRRLDTVARYCHAFGRSFERMRKSRVVRLILTEEETELTLRRREEAKTLGVAEEYMQAYHARQREVWGPPDRAIEDLRKIIDLGFDLIVFRLAGSYMGGPDAEIATARVFAKEIMPTLKAKYS